MINALKRGLKQKLEVESSLNIIAIILNAISFGIAGVGIHTKIATAIGSIADFDDVHCVEEVESLSTDAKTWIEHCRC